MKNKLFLIVLLLLLLTGSIFAEITFSGDARIRPRLDQRFSAQDLTSADVYYFYWARLWMDATLTEGWYCRAKLSADGPADFIGKLGDSNTFDGIESWSGANAAHGGSRGAVRFSELHFGRKTEDFGFSMGILPFNGSAHPEYDLHFFPTTALNIPYLIINRNSAAGFRGYYKIGPGKLTASLSVDHNLGVNDGDENTDDARDQYSLFLDYALKLGGIQIQPTFIKTIASPDTGAAGAPLKAPMSVGANVGLPKIAGISSSLGAYLSSQPVEDGADKYNGFMVHGKLARKLGPGTFIAWGDYRSITYDGVDDPTNTTVIWLMYKYVLYKSDLGSFSVSPTFRRAMKTESGEDDYARNNIELTMHFTFK